MILLPPCRRHKTTRPYRERRGRPPEKSATCASSRSAHLQLDSVLTPAQFVAYQRLLLHYVSSDEGGLPDDDKTLAALAKVSAPQWRGIREKLLAGRLCSVADGRWIDDDQDQNRDRQLAASKKASEAAKVRHLRAVPRA